MTVIDVSRDPEELTLTMVLEFPHPVERVWQLYADPRQLERWWGPPGWPATFETHDFRPGGRAAYHMTGPDGEKAPGWWEFTAIDAPRSLEIVDGFADESGQPVQGELNTTFTVAFDEIPAGTRVTSVTRFASAEQLEQLVSMGMEEGMRLGAEQMDAVLAEAV